MSGISEGLLYAAGLGSSDSASAGSWGYTPTNGAFGQNAPAQPNTINLLQNFDANAVGKQMVDGKLVAPDTLSWDSAFGYTDANGSSIAGWGVQGLGAASSLMGMYGGMEQLNLAKKNYALQKQAFEQNYNANRTAYNSAVANQWGRAKANGQTTMNESEYMAKYGLK